eukprot:SAG31_NODE_117_length_24022_cov_6.878067_10_plen_118_part_00
MAEAVKRALTKDPQLRPADATEMLENLKEILASDDEKIYHVFISYRVATEAAFAAELFRKLSQELVGSYKERMVRDRCYCIECLVALNGAVRRSCTWIGYGCSMGKSLTKDSCKVCH